MAPPSKVHGAKWPPLVPYLGAAVLVVAALLIRLPVERFLGGAAPYALFYLPVLMCAWFWGVRSAVLASLLSGFVAMKFLIPPHDPRAIPSLVPFALACAGMVVMARAARDLRGREERANAYLAAIVRSSDDAILSKTLDGIIQDCNPTCERLFGYPATDLIGRPITLLIPPELQSEELDILARLRRGERVDHFETVRLTKDGRRIDVSLTISPVLGPNGQILGVSKVVRDITERKRAARELAAQHEWFRVTLSSIGDAVIACDPGGAVTFLNATAERLTGWDEPAARGRPLSEIFRILNEQTQQEADDPVARVLRTGQTVGLANHTVLISKDGTASPIADSAAPIRDASGTTLGVVLVFHDVTEQRRAEAAIADQREWLGRTLESIGDAVIATDMHGNVAFMNPIAEHLTGWSAAEAVGQDCQQVFHILNEKTRHAVDSPVKRVLREGTVVGLANHTILVSRDGGERPIDDSGAPIHSRDGRIIGVVLVFRDVSEQRSNEAERQASELERERLLEAERIARSEAERANRIKDDFMAMVSHELRTPLNAILGWTEILLRSSDTESRHGLEVIQRNTRVQAQLISDLLDISRIVSGKLLLAVQSLDLATVIDAAIETVQHAANAKGVAIHRRLDTRASVTIGDPARLQQVIWNLLSNAIKFTDRGGRIDVAMQRVDSRLEIAIRDTGLGIRPELLDRIFDRFHQQAAPTTRRHGGLGLGLSIVKHLVELHGGSVRAESDGEGQGATFIVSLPISAMRSNEGAPAAGVERTGLLDAQALRGIRVLVVEDEADTRDLLRRLLEGHGAAVLLAANAEEAMELFMQQRPQILVSDIGLPDVDGYELVRRIRRREAPKENIPALALTAFARSEDRTRALVAGYQAHLAKPVEPIELVAMLARFADLIPANRREV